MSNKEYIDYLQKNADIGFVSLQGQLAELCVPSKLYEFINLGLPILGVLGGDGKNIICTNHYGIVADYNTQSLRNSILEMAHSERLLAYRNNVIRDREKWAMNYQIRDVLSIIDNI